MHKKLNCIAISFFILLFGFEIGWILGRESELNRLDRLESDSINNYIVVISSNYRGKLITGDNCKEAGILNELREENQLLIFKLRSTLNKTNLDFESKSQLNMLISFLYSFDQLLNYMVFVPDGSNNDYAQDLLWRVYDTVFYNIYSNENAFKTLLERMGTEESKTLCLDISNFTIEHMPA